MIMIIVIIVIIIIIIIIYCSDIFTYPRIPCHNTLGMGQPPLVREGKFKL